MGPDDERKAPIRADFRGDDHDAARSREPSPAADAVPLAQIEADFAILERDFEAAPDKAKLIGRIRALRRALGNRRSRVAPLFERLKRMETVAATVIGDRKTRKTDLCLLAERLVTSTEWKSTGDRLAGMMAAWKEIGWAGDAEEYLWQRFRAAHQAFHERRIAHFASER